MPNKIHHRHRQLKKNLWCLLWYRVSVIHPPPTVRRGSIQFRKTADLSYATYNTLVWRYFTFQKGGLVSDLLWTTRFTRTRKARSTLRFSSVLEESDIRHLLDPLFKDQWDLVNDEHPEHTMNTTPVWVLGFSVKDVLVSYFDDGLYLEADDLKVCTSFCYSYCSWTFFWPQVLF